MLQAIRDKAQGWIAWVIVGLIILTFALFGIDQYARGDKVVVVAEVNGDDVTAREFLTLYNSQKSRLQQQFGDMYDQVVNDEQLREQVLDSLIESVVIRQWGKENGLLISDRQLASTIHSAEVFQQDGQFSEKVYEEVLLRNGLNVARFEYEQRQFLTENQFRALSESSSIATGFEVEQIAGLQGQQREVNYLRIDQRPFLKTVKIDDEQIASYYESNRSAYVEPEKVALEYIELSQAELAKQVAVDEPQLQAYYEENKLLFTQPEQRHAKHILISYTDGEEKALNTVAEIQKKLAEGESFESLAQAYSQDPGSAPSGGDLGTFEQGMMVPEFDSAVFSMQTGQVSEPVKTDFGYHLIKLEGIEPKKTQPFSEVKSQVSEQFRMQEAEKRYFDLLEQLNTVAYEQPDSLEPAAQAIGLQVQSSEPVSREGAAGTILSHPKVLNAAFSEEVLKSKLNSASIDVAPQHAVVIRVKALYEAHQKPLEEVRASIEERLVRDAAQKEAAELAEVLMVKLQAGEAPESLMSKGVEWHTVGWIGRDNQRVLPQITSQVFKAEKPEQGQSTWRSHQLTTGDTVLIQVKGVKQMDVEPGQKEQLQLAVSELMAGSELEARLQALMAGADVIKKQNYKTLK